jgi:hypothetical protein
MDSAEPIQTADELPPSVADEAERTGLPAVQPKAQLVAQESVMAIMPTTIEEAARYASGLCLANIVPDAFREGGRKENPANKELVMMGVLKAMEIGVPPQTGLAGLLPINGRFSVWGDLAAALVQRTGQVERQQVIEIGNSFDPETAIGEWPADYGFRVLYWRKGQADPYVGEFTVRDAKRAGLWANARRQPWILYPKRMLFNRARAFALRDGFADGLNGLTIAEEVMDHLPPSVDERGPSKRLSALLDDEIVAAGETEPETEA